jgi:hypothetical protein
MRQQTILLIAFLLLETPFAHAGELVIRNVSTSPIVCHADGYSGWDIRVEPGVETRVGPNYANDPRLIDWAECQGLRTRKMNISPEGPDGLLVLNGKQTRVLNVDLYPYIPSSPNGNFQKLITHVINSYQALQPDVLLNVVMSINTYDFDLLTKLLSSDGYDVIELDMLYLGFLESNKLIAPVQIAGDQALPVALAASSVNGVLYGIPSWLCMDFIFSFSPELKSAKTLPDLLAFLRKQSKVRPQMLGDYDGSWRLQGLYINAYAQTYGSASLSKALQMPPDPKVIDELLSLVDTCTFSQMNECIDNTFHSDPDGTKERIFAAGNSSDDLGFSEQSFYISLNQLVPGALTIIPARWGDREQPLFYADSFVNNKATCASGQCVKDSSTFTTLMTSSAMKTYIAYSHDLTSDAPPRHLLVATSPFWDLDTVKSDPIYQQLVPIVRAGQPFPNSFSKNLQSKMGTEICIALKNRIPGYHCKTK